MSRTPFVTGAAMNCISRAQGGAAPLMVRAACGENTSMVQFAPVRAAAGGANAKAKGRGGFLPRPS